MAKASKNVLGMKQQYEITEALKNHIEEGKPPFKNMITLSEVLTATHGYEVTRHNVKKIIEKMELPFEKLVAYGSGGDKTALQDLTSRVEVLEKTVADLVKLLTE